MDITLRLEEIKDYEVVENLTREAFWDVYKPGCDEHLILKQLRESEGFVKELDYLAIDGDKIVGNIVYTKVTVENSTANNEVLCMGPIGVLPEYKGKGIGSMLMKHTIELARAMGFKGIILYGDPKFYHRFGFVNAEKYGLQTSWGANFEEFMALELSEGSLKGMSGKCFEDKAFAVDEADLVEFEKKFPAKESHFQGEAPTHK